MSGRGPDSETQLHVHAGMSCCFWAETLPSEFCSGMVQYTSSSGIIPKSLASLLGLPEKNPEPPSSEIVLVRFFGPSNEKNCLKWWL